MTRAKTLHLFDGYGIELEYMIVEKDSLAVRPIADELLKAVSGNYEGDADLGSIAWSNELQLHVIELKTNGPTDELAGVSPLFQGNVQYINRILAPMGAMLMPTAMHPLMRPETELKLWPHEYSAVYHTFDRIFRCQGHGWANIQSVHLNLPFGNDREFGRLHAAIRLVLPILPALAASSPIVEGQATGALDSRLEYYRTNAAKVPSVSGVMVPEPVFSRRDYEEVILKRIYQDLAPFDPDGALRYEWANARGCIARFVRNTIEVRLLDIQECPRADLAVVAAVASVVRALVDERLASYRSQKSWSEQPLAEILRATMVTADETVISDAGYLSMMGYRDGSRGTARELWQHLIESTLATEAGYTEWKEPLQVILREGCLARRIRTAVGSEVRPETVRSVYRELCRCLETGAMFTGHAA